MGKFNGIITAIITPFNKDGTIFTEGIYNEIEYLHGNGIENLFINGSYGAFPLMTTSERKYVAQIAVEAASHHFMKSIVQVGSPSTKTAVELAKHAEDIGANAVSAVVPFYYSTTIYKEKDFLKYFEEITSNVSIEVHCYNNIHTTGFNVSPSMLGKLIDLGLTGIKDIGGNMGHVLEMLDVIKEKDVEFDYYPSSTASLITGFLCGADSCISGISLTVPKMINNIYGHMLNSDVRTAMVIWKKVMKVRTILGKRSGRAIGAYEVLNSRGVKVGTCRAPWQKLKGDESMQMIKELHEIGVNINDRFFR